MGRERKFWFRRVFLMAAAGIFLYGCSGKDASEVSASREFFAMDTVMTVTAYGERCEEAAEAAEKEAERLDALLSTGAADSEVSRLNREGGGSVSEDTAVLIEKAGRICEKTDGAFDISIYPVMRAWGFTDKKYQVPEPGELTVLLDRVDGSQIRLDGNRKKVLFGLDGMEIDLGGIAKGYASNRMMKIFQEYGVESGIVSLGGNVQVLGTKADGGNWRVAVRNPEGDGDFLGVLSVNGKAVVTSGGYERYFERDGKTYHHILDPASGYPADSGLVSVTVVSEDGVFADGLSTALFVMGMEQAVPFWKSHSEDFDAVFLDKEGGLWITEGLEGAFQSDFSCEIIRK
ncbi:FAD:protein FMN transferase [Lachnospiraceae bacterium 46-15]